jgi:glycopeptide antibiotics resistance protein
LYFLILLYVCFFSEAYGRTDIPDAYHFNLIPFKEITRFYIYRDVVGVRAFALNLFGNVFAFVPFGLFISILFARKRHFRNILRMTFFLSLGIEIIQLLTRTGSFDVDDLILNTIGGVLGFLLFIVLDAFRRYRYE